MLSPRGRIHRGYLEGSKNKELVRVIQLTAIVGSAFYLYHSVNNFHDSESVALEEMSKAYFARNFCRPQLTIRDWSLSLKRHTGADDCYAAIEAVRVKAFSIPTYFCRYKGDGFDKALDTKDKVANLMIHADKVCNARYIGEAVSNSKGSLFYTVSLITSLVLDGRSQYSSKFAAGSLSAIHSGLCYVPGYSWALGLDKWRRM